MALHGMDLLVLVVHQLKYSMFKLMLAYVLKIQTGMARHVLHVQMDLSGMLKSMHVGAILVL